MKKPQTAEQINRPQLGSIDGNLLPHVPLKMRLATMKEAQFCDTALLEFLEAQSDGSPWVARKSTTGRGYRLHNLGPNAKPQDGYRTAREAIKAAMQQAAIKTKAAGQFSREVER